LNTFSQFGLSKQLLASLADAGFETPTEIQTKSIGVVLEGSDLVATAQTGSGKTAAYALPVIERLQTSNGKTRALILVPTRELATQVSQQFKLLSKYLKLKTVAIYGGVNLERQRRDLHRGVDIIIATPGRLFDCMQRKWVNLSQVQINVMDEADRMLDMGFMPQVRRIVSNLPTQCQTLMFSATIDKRVQQIASEFLEKPVTVKSDIAQIEPAAIEQSIVRVHEFDKDALLLKLLGEINSSMLVFAGMRRKVKWITDRLREAGIKADEIHSEIRQNKREQALARFKSGATQVLVATDVAARGLDIPSISHVINYDVPLSPEDYVHRIGRTGRAGRSGIAITFVSNEQRHLVRAIEAKVGKQLDPDAPRPKNNAKPPSRRFRSRRRRA
jgi:ATP-dependent RNA helicase RhlE